MPDRQQKRKYGRSLWNCNVETSFIIVFRKRGGWVNKRQIGKEKETLACDFLKRKGFEIIAVNYWCRYSEIDIIAKEGNCLVFVEVKYRKNADCGGSSYAVSRSKMKKICQCATYYIYRENVQPDTPMRFDVIAIDGRQIRHFVNAFEAM